jgi:hypothetical protein
MQGVLLNLTPSQWGIPSSGRGFEELGKPCQFLKNRNLNKLILFRGEDCYVIFHPLELLQKRSPYLGFEKQNSRKPDQAAGVREPEI